MSLPPIPPYELIETPAAWAECLADLRRYDAIAIDLESNSMYVYQEYICLIQISTPDKDYIIDPLEPLDLTGLGQLVEDPAVEKILHAGEYDLMLMKREHGWEMNNLFDTMWAARVLGYERIGLANMLEELFGVQLDKKFQRSNWGQRPLSADMLDYAQRDTHYLFDMRRRLTEELQETGRWEEAQETFTQQTDITLPDTDFDPENFWSVSGAYKLRGQSRAILKALYLYTHEQAQQADCPPFRILSNKAIYQISRRKPSKMSDLHKIRALKRHVIRKRGGQILRVVQQARYAPVPDRPARKPRLEQAIVDRYDVLQTWRKERGIERGVESDVIVSRDALWTLAHANPQNMNEMNELAEELGPWRTQKYGPEILDVLRGM